MKRVLSIIAVTALIAFVMASCTRNPATADAKQVSYEDTAGFAQFQAWKALNERVDPSQYQQPQQVQYVSAPAKKVVRRTAPKATSNSGSMNSESSNQAKVKKGWSKAAKYSVIGGAAGGVLGAVINKKDRVKGGVIGAVLGAGGGYVLGRSQDKKDGRVQ